MLSNKPYLIRAFYEWIVDSKCTPFLIVNANVQGCKVPTDYIEDGQITLNVAPEAIRDLKLGNDLIEFRASFNGIVHLISVPVKAVLAVHAQENGQGMFFDFEEEDASSDIEQASPNPSSSAETANAKPKSSHLKLVD